MKKCSKCKILKEPAMFHKHSKNKDGLQDWCRKCKSLQNKKTYDFEKHKEYREKNKEAIRERKRKYRLNNLERENTRVKKWHAQNPEKVNEYRRRYQEKNPGKDLKRFLKWIKENPDKKGIGRKELRLSYVAYVMTRREPRLKASDIPIDVLKAKKYQLLINRLIKEKNA